MMKVGSAVGGGVATKVGASFLPESSLMKTAAKYVSMGTGALMILLGILIIFFGHWIIGPIVIPIGGLMLIIEFAVPFAMQYQFFLFLYDYKYRTIYAAFCIPCFFSVFTIAPGLGCIAAGAIYGLLGFVKNESPEKPEEYSKQRDVEQGNGGNGEKH